MKGERIYNSLSLVEEKYIVEAAPVFRAGRNGIRIRWASLAACLVAVISIGAFFLWSTSRKDGSITQYAITWLEQPEQLILRIEGWQSDGFVGVVDDDSDNSIFKKGEKIFVMLTANTAVVQQDGSLFTYDFDHPNGESCNLPVGSAVSVEFRGYHNIPENSEFNRIVSVHVETDSPVENNSTVDDQIKYQIMIQFSQNFINIFNGGIASLESVDLTEYIKNENLLEFSYRMIELSRKQNEAGASFVLYGENNVFGEAEVKELCEEIYYLEIPFQYEGSGRKCKLLIKVTGENMEIVDFYFGSKDGIDTIATGHSSVRTLDDSELWNDEDWVTEVFEKMAAYERELE